MVEHIREPDGTWRFDYGPFDRYVEYCASFGIDGQIDCVSLLTWGYQYSYTEASTGAERTINAAPESKEYADYWRPFLADSGMDAVWNGKKTAKDYIGGILPQVQKLFDENRPK